MCKNQAWLHGGAEGGVGWRVTQAEKIRKRASRMGGRRRWVIGEGVKRGKAVTYA